MIKTKLFLAFLAIAVTFGPRYYKDEPVRYDDYTESHIVLDHYYIFGHKLPELPETPIEPEKPIREVVEELIAKGKYILTGYCSCDKCSGSFGGRKAKGLPPGIEIEGDTIPSVISLGSYIMKDGIRYILKEGELIEYTDIDTYCGKYVECNCRKCNGRHDYFLVRR